MNKLLAFLCICLVLSCKIQTDTKIPCYAWLHSPDNSSDKELKEKFEDLKQKGIDGLMYNAGRDIATYQRLGKIAKACNLEFYAWIPTLVQNNNPDLKPEWYAINGKGESAFEKPAYTDYYKFVCPNREEIANYLLELYGKVADIPEVDGIHLDYIRFPDVILAKGLWKKYNLVMDREYPQFDYCYCEKCVNDFKAQTGIDISKVKDPSEVQEWKQFRYNLITNLVNRLADMAHSKNKKINAAVFPGPNSVAKKIVRQEWNKWNLDAFFPMNYNDFYLENTNWIGAICKEEANSVEHKKPIYSGLFICPDPQKKASEPDPENHGLVPEELEAAIKASIENGATGICLFTPDRMTPEGWIVLEKALHADYSKK